MATDLQLSGLASGFDWKTLVENLMTVERAPIDRLNTEKTKNNSKVSALTVLGTKLTALQDSATALGAEGAFSGRTATSTTASSTWSASAGTSAANGSYKIAVTQLASAARREGATDIGAGISATNNVSGTTLATLPIASAITAGTFTVNGQKITVATTDSLQSVFDAISTATGGTVTASYDAGTDKITLSGSGEIVLGAANDTSNFLGALKLANNGTNTVASSTKLGTVKSTATLANANLGTALSGVDGSGNGSFAINGVTISYNVNTDTLGSVLSKINQSAAGVTATYDAANDRMTLTNANTGDIGIGASDGTGNLLAALGLTTGATLSRGKNAVFTVNDGATLYSSSNTLDATAHGVTGLSVTVNTESTQTIQVAGDTKGMRAKIDDFIAKFNDVQDYLDTATKVTSANGKVTTSVLSDNREIQAWGSSLRRMAFTAIDGLSGTISRLEHLGIDFTSGTAKLQVKDGAKLDAALRDKSTDVDAFFRKASTGFAAQFKTFLTNAGTQNGAQQANLNKNNTSLDTQIADIERRLTQQREMMTSAFIAMETAQSKLQSQQSALTNALKSS